MLSPEIAGFHPGLGCKSLEMPDNNRCRECMWFDPAYDQCPFFGTVRADDAACENFQPAE
jgi:hypothetical protein